MITISLSVRTINIRTNYKIMVIMLDSSMRILNVTSLTERG